MHGPLNVKFVIRCILFLARNGYSPWLDVTHCT